MKAFTRHAPSALLRFASARAFRSPGRRLSAHRAAGEAPIAPDARDVLCVHGATFGADLSIFFSFEDGPLFVSSR